MPPTQVTDLGPEFLNIGKRSVKFFLCESGAHWEPWRGETDNPSLPWRPCKKCGQKMELTSRRITPDGKLAPFKKQARHATRAEKQAASTRAVLRRFLRHIHHPYIKYKKTEWGDDVTAEVTRKNERPRQVGNKLYYRYALVEVVGESTVSVKLYGVRGWWEEFRVAGKRAHVSVCPKFMPEEERIIYVKMRKEPDDNNTKRIRKSKKSAKGV